MAVYDDAKRVSVTILLNNGTIDGVTRTVSVPLPSLDVDEIDNQKYMNIKTALVPCLAKSVYAVRKTLVSELTEE